MVSEIFPAHIRVNDDNTQEEQSCNAHSRMTAEYAKRALESVGLGNAAYLAGLLHDMGKYHRDFAAYLSAAAAGEDVSRGSVIHTFAGVWYLMRHYHSAEDGSGWRNTVCELLAYAVGAHHGLFDCVNENSKSGFEHRLDKDVKRSSEAERAFLEICASQLELDAQFQQAYDELEPVLERLLDFGSDDEVDFYIGMLARLLLSAVMEGDRRDTAEFMEDAAFPEQKGCRELWQDCLHRVEQRIALLPQDTLINQMRGRISQQCRDFASHPTGIYRLNVPTGGGKTLSSLRFALAHAAEWGKARIIFTSPLLSILDQNAQVIRDYVADDSLILEHHSNLVQEHTEESKLLTENYHAPIIITTLVQLLNTLFEGRTASIRRFQALCSSVIVIDEVQTVPNKMLTLFNLAVNFLAEVCQATVILCSATQPALEQAVHPLKASYDSMVPYDPQLWEVFRRTEICNAGSMTLDEIAAFTACRAAEYRSVLLVCNTKRQAAKLYGALSKQFPDCCHLSAAMCMAHRREVLTDINDKLKMPDHKVICISTQVIEAGVDISFACVIRLSAGMDNIVQAAGRCNRNGESETPLPVYVVPCKDENLHRLTEIARAKTATEALLERYSRDPASFADNLASDASIAFYYRKLYEEMESGYQDFTYRKGRSIFDLLSVNSTFVGGRDCDLVLRQAFAEAGKQFAVFDTQTYDIIVPHKDGKQIIAELCGEKVKHNTGYAKELLRKAKPYTVSIYEYQKKALEQCGGIFTVLDGSVMILQDGFYHEVTGLQTDAESEGDICSTQMW